jgi:glycosyltransferase involved in cell wall biosynthesis
VYLYSEVMPYAIAVMRALVKEHGVAVDCICWDRNKRTPFVPVNEQGITFHKRSDFDEVRIVKFIEERDPAIIYVTGRMDELYMKAALHFKKKCCIVTGSDNQWTGSLKQRIAAVLSGGLYKKYFEYFWVPGKRQYEYARRMGYAENKIIRNLLTADTAVFGNVYEQNRAAKKMKYPHTMVYAGRFAKEKGVDVLIAAFSEAKKETNSDWVLRLVGFGDMPVTEAPFIKVEGFMQGPELAAACKDWGVFCLPSTYEPWGVVIHEFAMAGLPIICSDKVGAGDDLVVSGKNGIVFKSGDTGDLKKAIIEIISKSDNELMAMAERGHEMSLVQSPSIAARSLMRILA